MLTPEERKRIEDEERKRIAEEQYRTEVRSKLREESGTLPRQPSRLPWALGVGVVLILGVIIIRFNTSKQPKEADASAPTSTRASGEDEVCTCQSENRH